MDTPEQRKQKTVKAAWAAVQREPKRLAQILEQVYEHAQSDWERVHFTHVRVINGKQTYFYEKIADDHDPLKP